MKTQNIIHENTKYKTQTQNIRTKEAQICLDGQIQIKQLEKISSGTGKIMMALALRKLIELEKKQL